jgi:hypothetical protein
MGALKALEKPSSWTEMDRTHLSEQEQGVPLTFVSLATYLFRELLELHAVHGEELTKALQFSLEGASAQSGFEKHLSVHDAHTLELGEAATAVALLWRQLLLSLEEQQKLEGCNEPLSFWSLCDMELQSQRLKRVIATKQRISVGAATFFSPSLVQTGVAAMTDDDLYNSNNKQNLDSNKPMLEPEGLLLDQLSLDEQLAELRWEVLCFVAPLHCPRELQDTTQPNPLSFHNWALVERLLKASPLAVEAKPRASYFALSREEGTQRHSSYLRELLRRCLFLSRLWAVNLEIPLLFWEHFVSNNFHTEHSQWPHTPSSSDPDSLELSHVAHKHDSEFVLFLRLLHLMLERTANPGAINKLSSKLFVSFPVSNERLTLHALRNCISLVLVFFPFLPERQHVSLGKRINGKKKKVKYRFFF